MNQRWWIKRDKFADCNFFPVLLCIPEIVLHLLQPDLRYGLEIAILVEQ